MFRSLFSLSNLTTHLTTHQNALHLSIQWPNKSRPENRVAPNTPNHKRGSNRGIVNKEIRHKNHNMTNPPYGYGYGYQLKSLGATQMAFQQRYADNRGAALGKASASSKGLAWSGGGNSCGPRRPGGPRTTRSWNESFDFRGCVCVCICVYIYIYNVSVWVCVCVCDGYCGDIMGM